MAVRKGAELLEVISLAKPGFLPLFHQEQDVTVELLVLARTDATW